MTVGVEERDVVILGAGVSGSSTAIRLCAAGIRPLVIDKASFPRDTIGEALSPAVYPYLEELGLIDVINSGEPFVKKTSFELVAPDGTTSYTHIDLTKAPYNEGRHQSPWGFNCRRRHFDMAFVERARAVGADVRLETTVTAILTDGNGRVTGVTTDGADGPRQVRSRVLIDCSGRASILAQQLGLRAPLEHVFEGQWGNFAIRCDFHGSDRGPLAAGHADYDPATVSILPYDDCWFWFIPISLTEDIVSVGIVARAKMASFLKGFDDRKDAYRTLMSKHPVLREVIRNASMSDNIVSTSRLGHMNTRFCGDGYLCVGDAAFFADPAWATGVTICLHTSKLAAQTVIEASELGEFSAAMLAPYEAKFRAFISDPFNSIRAFNYYYNDSDYINFLVRRLAEHQDEMDMVGGVIFDYISHRHFQSWTYRVFKAYYSERGRVPIMDRVSRFDYERAPVTA